MATFVHGFNLKGGRPMFDFEEYVESGFAHTGPRNPLRTLAPEDKIVLVSLLTLYLEPCPPGRRGV